MVRDSLIICTRNRVADLEKCLRSVTTSSSVPAEILVVDSSDDDETELLIGRLSYPIEYVRSAPGLTVQRNIGLRMASGDVVHFLDDDVEIGADYFHHVLRAFNADPSVVGVGGMVLGASPGIPSLGSRLGLRNSLKKGRVLRSGFNVGCFDLSLLATVEWLPGCSMSYRTSALDGQMFDERRRGYSTGEDVDFSMRVGKKGVLLHVPAARLVHHQSPKNRAKLPAIVASAVHSRWQLAEDGLGSVRFGWVIYGTLSQSAAYMIKAIVRRDLVYLQCAVACIRELIQVIRHGASVYVR